MKQIFIVLVLLLTTACTSTSYTTQVDENAYIQFSGNYQGSQVQIDETVFTITEATESFNLNGMQVVKFEIPTGKSQLVVSKDGAVVIKKYLFTNEGQTVEVNIP